VAGQTVGACNFFGITLKIHNWLPNLLELTNWSEIFTEVTVHQDKFFRLSNFEKFSKLFRKFEIEISKIDNFGLAYLFAPLMLQVQTHAAVFYDPSALLSCRYLRWHFTFWRTMGHF
jgi:hypothetical protein